MGYCLDDSPRFQMLELGEVDSTNSYLRGYRPPRPAEVTLVTAEYQTAGRGQQGNSWEAEAGRNLLFSLLVQPTQLPADHVFVLSEAIALSIRDAVAAFLPADKVCTVKWPNDIYVDDSKIAGILIENEWAGRHVGRSILGCGVDVNQQRFLSDAPNPVSLLQLTGQEVERRFVLEKIMEGFCHRYEMIQQQCYDAIHAAYLAALYRRTGLHPFHDHAGNFMAEITDVALTGHLILRDSEGLERRYAFKEVAFGHFFA